MSSPPRRRRPPGGPRRGPSAEPPPQAWPTSPEPPRPSHEEVAAVLRGIVAGEPWLADQEPWELWGASGAQRVDAVGAGGVWRLVVWWDWPAEALHPRLATLDEAVCPAGRRWVRGCGRWPSWEAGPEAVVLDPVHHLLEEAERWRLEERLSLQVVRMPMPVFEMVEPPSIEELDEWIEQASRP